MKTETPPTIPCIFDFAPQEIYWRWHRRGLIREDNEGNKWFVRLPLVDYSYYLTLLTEYWIAYPYVKKGQVEKLNSRNQIRHHGVWKRFTDILQTGALSNLSINDEKELKLALRALEYGLFNGGVKGSLLPQVKNKDRRTMWIWNYVTAYIKPETAEEHARLWSMISQL